MADKFMYIPNDCSQNFHFCRLQFVVETFKTLNFMNKPIKFINSPQNFKLTNRKTLM